jgi:L-alanine-DL-glutamate epimerase-like enolase superfamily enzyme
MIDGRLTVPTSPGIGVDIDFDFMESITSVKSMVGG